MTDHDWIKEFPASITVCDPTGIILAMNDRAAKKFDKDGGYALIGCSLLNCHSEESRKKVEALLASGQRDVYTIEKNGAHRLIYHSPWYKDGEYAGFVELSLDIPEEVPHFVRS